MTKELFQRFLNDQCSKEEQAHFYNWLANPKNKEEVTALMKVSWDHMPDKVPAMMRTKEAFIKNALEGAMDVKRYLDSDTGLSFDRSIGRSRFVPGRFWLKIAASIFIVLGLSFFAYQYFDVPDTPQGLIVIEKSNPQGQKSTLTLADGSTVKLNAESKIRFPEKFDAGQREVILEGEAFFNVEKDLSRPFIVRSGDISTTVLGTSFNVNAYAGSSHIEVAVVTGKVEVKKTADGTDNDDEKVHLLPNNMASYDLEKKQIITSKFDLEEITGWKDGILVLKDADMPEVVQKLERWYGVEIMVEDGTRFENKRFTGKFDNNSLEYVLKAICYTAKLDYEINNNQVKLKKK